MNSALRQFADFLKSLPLARKVAILFVVLLLAAGFVTMFLWANQVDYQVLFRGLSPEDAGAVIAELKKKNIPYQIEGNGTVLLVPREQVHDLRLTFAGEGLPKGGSVGFELFDKNDFRTTSFVQELNYKRALEGELSRTINRFQEVQSSKVFIVLPKQSLFVEASKPASASVQLELRSSLPPSRLAAIVHLVASAVEGLDPEQVTVVDTRGRVIFKGSSKEDAAALLNNIQIEYKRRVESEIRSDVESMLEGVVGPGKAIVRVSAQIDFSKVTSNAEEYDPSAGAVRSRRDIEESSRSGENASASEQTLVDERRGVLPSGAGSQSAKAKKDSTTNYEINKITRAIVSPAGNIKRLSVAAVIDGTYAQEKAADGKTKKSYVARTGEELKKFENLVKGAMGYSEDREDLVSIMSMPFSNEALVEGEPESTSLWKGVLEALASYKRTFVNGFLVLLVFFTIVRPLIKSLGKVAVLQGPRAVENALTGEAYPQIPAVGSLGPPKERVLAISKENPDKAYQLIKGWMSE
jgi:flagellar M-ring protein FliF